MMREVTISVQNAAEKIRQDPHLSKKAVFQDIVREARTLEATHSPPFLWRNLNQKAYDLCTPEVSRELEAEGVKVLKKKRGQLLRVENCRSYVGDPGSIEKCIAAGADKYPYLAIFRKGDQVGFTWYQ